MNKTAIRNFAVWARNKLIADVCYHAGLMGITKNGIDQALPQSTKDVEFFDIGTAEPYAVRGDAIQQRKSLVDAIRQREKDSNYETAYSSLMEEVAYTWFNRLIAVRFMEVNDYLPEHVRVLSSESGKQEPDLVTTPFDAELFFAEGEKQEIIQMKNDNKLDEVFRILFIKQCRELSKILPRLFEGTNDYTELLLSVSFIDQEGVVYHLVQDIPEEDFNVEQGGQVEIIGWLYQYYNAELKDETFALLKKNVKVTKERIPSATQLFTPDWIVRYMVENSLGRLWIEGHPNELLKSGWKYYLDEAEQEESVKQELEKIKSEYAKLSPEDIKVIDPCMGSGHILVYAFDVLMQIYESAGYTQRDAARSILEHNLFGLDIDDRAAQLAYFAVMMKARQYNRRILNGESDCNVYAIKESNRFDRAALMKMGDDLRPVAEKLVDTFVDAKEYGSILNVDLTLDELDALDKRLVDVDRMSDYGNLLDMMYASILCNELSVLIRQARVMVQKYDAVITNPPYMGGNSMDEHLSKYVKLYYPNTKTDLSTVMMEKSCEMIKELGYFSMINIPVWMFLSSYEKLRLKLIEECTFVNLLHFGRGIFGADFGTVSFVLRNRFPKGYMGQYRRLFDRQSIVDSVETKEEWFFDEKGKYVTGQTDFNYIGGNPIVYWAPKNLLEDFHIGDSLKLYGDTRQGMATSDNNRFLRLWYEVETKKIGFGMNNAEQAKSSMKKWFPYNKGGEFRKWYGNEDYIVNYENDGYEVKKYAADLYKTPSRTIKSMSEYFKPCLSWSKVTIGTVAFRYYPKGFVFDVAGCCVFYNNTEKMKYDFGFLNSCVAKTILEMISPTVNYEAGHIASLPVVGNYEESENIARLVDDNKAISKSDWDSFETSWDFKKHPLV